MIHVLSVEHLHRPTFGLLTSAALSSWQRFLFSSGGFDDEQPSIRHSAAEADTIERGIANWTAVPWASGSSGTSRAPGSWAGLTGFGCLSYTNFCLLASASPGANV